MTTPRERWLMPITAVADEAGMLGIPLRARPKQFAFVEEYGALFRWVPESALAVVTREVVADAGGQWVRVDADFAWEAQTSDATPVALVTIPVPVNTRLKVHYDLHSRDSADNLAFQETFQDFYRLAASVVAVDAGQLVRDVDGITQPGITLTATATGVDVAYTGKGSTDIRSRAKVWWETLPLTATV